MNSKFCKYCGEYIFPGDKLHKNQRVHISCAHKHGPDIIINSGKLHIELYSELISKSQLSKILKINY